MLKEKENKTIEQIKKLESYLSVSSKRELEQILAYGEKYRQGGENMKNKFWSKYNRNNFVNLIMCYEDNERMFFEGLSGEEQKLIGSLKGISKKKFIEEYLHDRIFYGGCLTNLGEHPKFEYSGLLHGIDYTKRFAMEWKNKLVKGAYIYFDETDINLQCLDIVAKEWKDSLKPGMGITFQKCYIGDQGAQILAEVWRDSLQLGMILDLNENHIGAEGAKALSKMKLQEGMYIGLYGNDLGDEGAEAISEVELENGVCLLLTGNKIGVEGAKALSKIKLKKGVHLCFDGNQIGDDGVKYMARNMKLEEGVELDLSYNSFGDEGAEVIMKNMKLKEGVILHLWHNNISDGMEQKLKEWEKSYRDKGIHCEVKF